MNQQLVSKSMPIYKSKYHSSLIKIIASQCWSNQSNQPVLVKFGLWSMINITMIKSTHATYGQPTVKSHLQSNFYNQTTWSKFSQALVKLSKRSQVNPPYMQLSKASQNWSSLTRVTKTKRDKNDKYVCPIADLPLLQRYNHVFMCPVVFPFQRNCSAKIEVGQIARITLIFD